VKSDAVERVVNEAMRRGHRRKLAHQLLSCTLTILMLCAGATAILLAHATTDHTRKLPSAASTTVRSLNTGLAANTAKALQALHTSIAYTIPTDSYTRQLFVAARGHKPVLVGIVPLSAEYWSTNGRYLVTIGGSDFGSVWRYDTQTNHLTKWNCDGCVEAAILNQDIVTVNARDQLLRFPLSGTKALPALPLVNLPEWTRESAGIPGIPFVLDTTASVIVLGWPLLSGNNEQGGVMLLSPSGRYLKTIVGPGRSDFGVPLLWDTSYGAPLAPDYLSILLSEQEATSACELSGHVVRVSLTGKRSQLYPSPKIPAATTPDWLNLAFDASGSAWGTFAGRGWVDGDCSQPTPNLYKWMNGSWKEEATGTLAVAFGPRDQPFYIRSSRLASTGISTGTLTTLEGGQEVQLARGVDTITVLG
jgi:hypothetical protein